MAPKSLLGKFVAGLCTLCGVFILKLPIPIIVNSFSALYDNRKWRTKLEVRRKKNFLNKAEQPKDAEIRKKKKDIMMVIFLNTIYSKICY